MAGFIFNFGTSSFLTSIEILVILTICVGNYYLPQTDLKNRICDPKNSSIVRKVIHKKWKPILTKHEITSLPVECPVHFGRDILGTRELHKKFISSHWECRKCGKKFYTENSLDEHFQLRHSETSKLGENSVCLSDYCEIMRCDILKWNIYANEQQKSTDVSIWIPSQMSYNDLFYNERIHSQNINQPPGRSVPKVPYMLSTGGSTICNTTYYSDLKSKCEELIWSCISGFVSKLDQKDFNRMQVELEETICSFLSCSRYGEIIEQGRVMATLRPFFIVFGSLLISLCLALAYYFSYLLSDVEGENAVHCSSEFGSSRPSRVNKTSRI